MQPVTPFDPADAGTPERDWCSLLSHREPWRPCPGPLIVVAPHPDDEVLGAGGLLRSWALNGNRVTVLSVTDGEAADPSRADLSRARRLELRNALRTLAVSHIEVKRLAIPDGKVEANKNRLRAALCESAMARATIVAPYENDGHPDHEATGRVCLEVAHTYSLPIVRYPVWAWHHATPATLHALRWGLFHFGSAARRAKSRAIQCFESQLRPPHGPAIVPPHVLSHFHRPYEAFVL